MTIVVVIAMPIVVAVAEISLALPILERMPTLCDEYKAVMVRLVVEWIRRW